MTTSIPPESEAQVPQPGQRRWNWMLWIPLIAVALWLGARWITPKMDASQPTPSALSEHLQATGFTLVSMGAEWCGACRRLDPEITALSAARPEVRVIKIDIDADPAIAQHYQVRMIPAMLLFRDGELVDHHVGVRSVAGLKRWIDEHRSPES
ncbi:MAG: thioredoxin [Planctomycetota bacterium]|nr:MAG: thioredoxin [Planctomycetota bacterium]